jgi:hypothetical protein
MKLAASAIPFLRMEPRSADSRKSVVIDPSHRRVSNGTGRLVLPPAQFALLLMIVRSERHAVDLETASKAIWPDASRRPTSWAALMMHLARDLRGKLQPFGFEFEFLANTIRVLERPDEVRVLSSPGTEPKETRAIEEVSAEQLQLTLIAEAIHDALWPNAPWSQTTTNHRKKLLNAAQRVAKIFG